MTEMIEQLKKFESFNASTFAQEDINYIHSYIDRAAGSSPPVRILYHLTDVPFEKAQIFIACYRLIESTKNYITQEGLREKLIVILDSCKNEFQELFILLQKFAQATNSNQNFGKHRIQAKIINVFLDYERNKRINKLIDFFLIFVEKQQVNDLDKISGIDLSVDEGKEVYKEIINRNVSEVSEEAPKSQDDDLEQDKEKEDE